MKILCVWPDGTWCWPDELSEMTHKSDDYRRIEVTDECDDEDAERIADMEGATCRCIDCGGTEPGHSPECHYMRDLVGTQP